MRGNLEDLIASHHATGIVLDTHMVVLYVVGSFDRELIPRFKRTQNYTQEDFDLLCTVIGFFQKLLVTPHILAEANGLLGQLPEPIRARCFAEPFLHTIASLDEKYVQSLPVAEANPFVKFD